MTTQKLSAGQQRIIDEMQNNELIAFVQDGEMELASFKRFAGFTPHLSAIKALIKKQLIECYDAQSRPGHVYDIWHYKRVADNF